MKLQVVVIQAHNKNPLNYLKRNPDLVVVEQLARLDAEFGDDAFSLCVVSHILLFVKTGMYKTSMDLNPEN